jgi:DNA polymerase-3 subunit beta
LFGRQITKTSKTEKQEQIVIIPKQAFRDAINAVAPFSPPRSTLPILTNIRVESTGEQLTFVASNLDSQIEYWIDAPGEPFAFCVDATALKRIAQFADDDVDLSCKNGKAVIGIGKAKTRLASLPAKDFPKLERAESALVELEWAPLEEQFQFAAQFCATNMVRPHLNCVHIKSTSTEINVFGTNGINLGFVSVPHIAAEFGICIQVDVARRMAGDFKTVTIRDNQVELRGDRAIALFKTAASKPLDMRRIIGLELPDSGEVERKSLLEAISFVGSFPDQGKARPMVKIEAGESNHVALVGRDNEATAPFEYEGSPVMFGAYVSDFSGFLKSLQGDKLKLQFKAADTSNTQIRILDGNRIICTMPARF